MRRYRSNLPSASIVFPSIQAAESTTINWLERELPDPEDQRRYGQERAIIAITEELAEAIDRAGLTRADIASRLGKSKSHISQVLSGRRNMTLRTLGDILWACGLELETIRVARLGEVTCPATQVAEWAATAQRFSATEPALKSSLKISGAAGSAHLTGHGVWTAAIKEPTSPESGGDGGPKAPAGNGLVQAA